jgi:hypothetical protein
MLSTLPIALAATVVSFLSFATPVVQAQAAACNGHAEYVGSLLLVPYFFDGEFWGRVSPDGSLSVH